MNFTHLHVHTEYSLLDGSGKIKEMVHRTKELGMDSLAITDHGVMYGVIDFYKACQAEGIKPIIGCEIYVAPNSRFDREPGASEDRYYHLVLLAENNTGYQNLMKIVSKGFLEGFYYKPRVDYEVLKTYSEGIIALSACLGGEVASNLRKGFYAEAKTAALRLREIFGEDNFFLELQDHGLDEQKSVNQGLFRLSQETGIKLVATNDVHYTYEEDAESHDILLCIQTQKKVSDEYRMRYEGGQFYLKSPEEMLSIFPYAKEALENTYEIAKRCNVTITFGEYKLPVYPVPEPYTAFEYLQKLCREGIESRYERVSEELWNRLEYELDTIRNMGFVDYFLIVWDFIKFAKDHQIMVGPGRGSAAGSIVAYSLEITDIDPIRYNLLFERFLNPERLTMPDIDIDFCYERRQEVIDYVTQKYGKDRVVQIVTFGTMAARAVIRDVGRALDLPYSQVDTVAKMIPSELNITIEKALNMNPDLKRMYEEDSEVKYLIDMSMRLEGLPRHTSMHAAGVVISKENIDEYVPLSISADDSITTQFPMTTLEELGLLKMDFLGLRTLTVLQNAETLINRNKRDGKLFRLDQIDFNDPKVYQLISSGKTEGVFQLESAGMKSLYKEFKKYNEENCPEMWKQMLVKYVYSRLSAAVKVDMGVSEGTHHFEAYPPVTMYAMESILARDVWDSVIASDAETYQKVQKYISVLRNYEVTSNSWGYVNLDLQNVAARTKLYLIDKCKLNEIKVENTTDMVWSRYTLGLQKVAEFFIWRDMLNVMGVSKDDITKEIEVIMFEG